MRYVNINGDKYEPGNIRICKFDFSDNKTKPEIYVYKDDQLINCFYREQNPTENYTELFKRNICSGQYDSIELSIEEFNTVMSLVFDELFKQT